MLGMKSVRGQKRNTVIFKRTTPFESIWICTTVLLRLLVRLWMTHPSGSGSSGKGACAVGPRVLEQGDSTWRCCRTTREGLEEFTTLLLLSPMILGTVAIPQLVTMKVDIMVPTTQ